jgi:lysozyme|tara:strand:+ start:463 stop:921 length:459 start_codon:yes stop_codon:yes gene_type:complete
MSVLSEAVDIAAKLCRTFEGLQLKPYICPAGYPTIGYGTVNKPDGTKVTMDHPPITKETAEEWLTTELVSTYMAGVLQASPILASKPRALGAITDFAYNLGVPRYRSSTLRRRIEAQDWEGAQEELMKWNKGGGRVLPGLVRRRQAECAFLN